MNLTEVHDLSLREKFQLLEAVWGDLSSEIEKAPVSESEKQLLDSRIERVESGESAVLNWNKVKHSIGEG